MSAKPLIDLVPVLERFVDRLRALAAELNRINVFPVADGDTGTNMVACASGILDEVRSADADPVAMATLVGRAALSHGRGNSGLILGQFLAGVAAAHASDRLDEALAAGARRARTAVSRPAEGTMLTVADAAANATDPADAVRLAREALAHTPQQLSVLAEAGVVDAGGAGLVEFFAALAGEDAGPGSVEAPVFDAPMFDDEGFQLAGDGPVVGYEVMFTTTSDRSTLMAELDRRGTDVVVAEHESSGQDDVSEQNDGDAPLLRAHVHVTLADRAEVTRWARSIGRDVHVTALIDNRLINNRLIDNRAGDWEWKPHG